MDPLAQYLTAGALDDSLCRLYGAHRLNHAHARCQSLLSAFGDAFHTEAQALFSAPGRTELGGNHTDHQNGLVLAAAVDLDLLAAVAVNDSGLVRLVTPGASLVSVELTRLEPVPEERYTSAALIRGVAAGMARLGCPFVGAGLDLCVFSDVPVGGGLSSSAAFELLLGSVFNAFFMDGKVSPMELAKIGQYAENHFFGKPCGLMDQVACALGGISAIDFFDSQAPQVTSLFLDAPAHGHTLCILDSGANHADLTQEYAAITQELGAVCSFFGKDVLREVPEEELMASLPLLRAKVGDRAILRAMHVYSENRRVKAQLHSLSEGDFDAFLALVRASGRSSAMYLQNVISSGRTRQQELMLTLALCERILGGSGAVRVHGGGFGGTVQAYVPTSMLPRFRAETEAVLGQGACRIINIRTAGAIRLA